MKLKFLIYTPVDSWTIKNKKCATCKHLIVNEKLGCDIRKQNFWRADFFNTCNNYQYIREYKQLK